VPQRILLSLCFLLIPYPLQGSPLRVSVLPNPAFALPEITSAVEILLTPLPHLGLFHGERRGFFAGIRAGGWEGSFDLRSEGGWIFTPFPFLELGGGLYLQSSGRSVLAVEGNRRYLREVRTGGEVLLIISFPPIFGIFGGEKGVTNARTSSGEAFRGFPYLSGGIRLGIRLPSSFLGVYLASSRGIDFMEQLSLPPFILGGFYGFILAP